MGLRYVIQVIVMITELVIPILSFWVILSYPTSIIAWTVALFCLYDCCKDGGPLISWHPKNIRKFMENAKKMGL